MIKRFIIFAISIVCSLGPLSNITAAEAATNLDQLLQQVKEGKSKESKENKTREQEFERDKARQIERLKKIKTMRTVAEARSKQMEDQFEANELQVVQLEETFTTRLGTLKELFGVLQQAAGDARGQFENSLTNIQYPDRGEFLTSFAEKMGSSSQLASIEEIERLWFELQREMTESGKVVKFPTTVIAENGDEVQKDIIRVGVFNIIADGKYLKYTKETGNVLVMQRQPKDRFVNTAVAIQNTNDGLVMFGLDPSRGQILSQLVKEPTLQEYREKGGPVGEVIIWMGIIAILIAVLKLIWLTFISMQVAVQKHRVQKPSRLNPLGRVLQVYHDNPKLDIETLELKLSEAVLKETSKLGRWNMLLKVIAVVAPLMGLLGTVVGMIITFQAITLFGTGDPKLMAGGISTALVTTVLGLCVAIPIVLLHTIVSGRSKRLTQILEEQAAGMVASQSEKQHQSNPVATVVA
jgi:biopolymer transport protein ExbB